MAVPPSTESAPSNANSEPEMTSQFAPLFHATTLPNPSFQERSLPTPSLQGTRQQTNTENRKKLTNPHSGGSKSNARRRGEIIAETWRRPGRAEMYLITRKKEDGSYVSEGAKEICEKFELALSQRTVDESQASPHDVFGKVLGKAHPGRVRCLGLGATPSIAFKQTNRRVSGMRFPSNDAGCSSSECQVKYNQFLNTLKAYMIMKEGSIPEQFAVIFDSTPTMPRDAASGPVSPVNDRRSVSASNSSDDVLENPFN